MIWVRSDLGFGPQLVWIGFEGLMHFGTMKPVRSQQTGTPMAKSSRWKPTISLRCLLLAVVLAALCFAYFSPFATFHRESIALRRLHRLGAKCTRRNFYDDLTPLQEAAVWWRHNSAVNRVASVDLSKAAITDADLDTLLQFHDLRSLDLSDTRISDKAVAVVSELPKLKRLNLAGTAVTSECGESLQKLSNLVRLNLSNTQVDDDIIDNLKKMPSLDVVLLDPERFKTKVIELPSSIIVLDRWAYPPVVSVDGF